LEFNIVLTERVLLVLLVGCFDDPACVDQEEGAKGVRGGEKEKEWE
jgi:hypothetical protein